MAVLGLSLVLVPTRDLAVLKTFYSAGLGLTVRRETSDIVTFTVPDSPELELVAGGAQFPLVTDRKQTPCIAIFHVDNVEATVDAALRAGGTIVNAPFRFGTQTLAYVADPEGHVIGMSSRNQTKS